VSFFHEEPSCHVEGCFVDDKHTSGSNQLQKMLFFETILAP
jgi:hypothetical protein